MKEKFVIVIDPGHGGTDGSTTDGASYDGITERNINMVTANAMYEELSTYDDVTVYLTHDSADTKMSLRERAEFAKSVGADYLISIHYNASEEHIFYGSEVWIPSTGLHYVQGYQLGSIFLDEFSQMGLMNRGIKTKVNDHGTDYYGIIRECDSLGVNALIVEHCYLDHINDSSYRDSEDDYVRFGIADATSVAKFLGLKSSQTGVDYSSYVNIDVPVPESIVYQDMTPPDQCTIQLAYEPEEAGNMDIFVNAYDTDSELSYYSYSLDGGITFSNLIPWVDSEHDSEEISAMQIHISDITTSEVHLMVRVYNQYNLYTSSQSLSVSFPVTENPQITESPSSQSGSIIENEHFSSTNEVPLKSILSMLVFFLIITGVMAKLLFKLYFHRK